MYHLSLFRRIWPKTKGSPGFSAKVFPIYRKDKKKTQKSMSAAFLAKGITNANTKNFEIANHRIAGAGTALLRIAHKNKIAKKFGILAIFTYIAD
jgi:hypothetical protein